MSTVIRKILARNIQNIIKCLYSTEGRIFNGLPVVQIPETTIHDLVFEQFSRWDNNRIALECALTGRNYTFNDIRSKATRLNKALRKNLKLQKGDVVALLLPNVPEFPIAALGILKAGLVITTINPIYTSGEVSKQLTDSSAKAIITLSNLCSLADNALKEANIRLPILTIKSVKGESTPVGTIDFSEFTDNDVNLPDITDLSSKDLAILPYSSGTTGLPKGVRLSHSNVVSNISQMAHPDTMMTLHATETHQDITPAVLPMFHIYGFTITCVVQMIFGAKIITLPKFSPELYITTLQKHKPHILYLAPPIAIFLANHPSITKELFENMRTIVSGAAPLGATDEEKLLKKAQKQVNMLQGYGLTETSPVVLSTRISIKQSTECGGSLGIPIPNTEVKIIAIDDNQGIPLGPNQKGELLIRGPQVMQGYHNRPEETDNAFLDGWLRTGDIMYYDDRGLFYITDRLKELIKVKGFQVAPAELEEIIRNHPDIADAAVIGVPHPIDGEVPKAFVVPKPGAKINVNNLKEFVNTNVVSYKQLKGGVVITESIPKNASGKILRRELKIIDQNLEK